MIGISLENYHEKGNSLQMFSVCSAKRFYTESCTVVIHVTWRGLLYQNNINSYVTTLFASTVVISFQKPSISSQCLSKVLTEILWGHKNSVIMLSLCHLFPVCCASTDDAITNPGKDDISTLTVSMSRLHYCC